MAAQQNNHRTHGLLSFMLNDTSEICHYFDPISHYSYNVSTRRPKPLSQRRLRRYRSSRVNLCCEKLWESAVSAHFLFSLSLFLRHNQVALASWQWEAHPFKLLLYNLQPNSSINRIHLYISFHSIKNLPKISLESDLSQPIPSSHLHFKGFFLHSQVKMTIAMILLIRV